VVWGEDVRDLKRVILERLGSIADLPSLPEVVRRLEITATDPRSDAKALAAVLQTDPAMAARVLKVANSAYYGAASQQIASVPQAVARLGFKEVRKLCIAIAAMRMFVRASENIDHYEFWRHSLTVGAATRVVLNLSGNRTVDPDEAFTAGLLHEIGALVLDQYFQAVYALIHKEVARSNQSIQLVENESLKINHAEIGAWLLNRWGLPGRLVDAVGFHHNPDAASTEHRTICGLVHLADYASSIQGISGPGERLRHEDMSTEAWNHLGLGAVSVTDLMTAIGQEADRSTVFLAAAA
jgi:HD-like signal output (HDOD) protein